MHSTHFELDPRVFEPRMLKEFFSAWPLCRIFVEALSEEVFQSFGAVRWQRRRGIFYDVEQDYKESNVSNRSRSRKHQ